jgi:hypothetical protein
MHLCLFLRKLWTSEVWVNMSILVFSVLTPSGRVGRYQRPEQQTAFTFRAQHFLLRLPVWQIEPGSVWLHTGRSDHQGSIPGAGADDFSYSLCVLTGSEAHPASYPMGTAGRDTTHPHLVPRSKMSRSYTPLLVACVGVVEQLCLSYVTVIGVFVPHIAKPGCRKGRIIITMTTEYTCHPCVLPSW